MKIIKHLPNALTCSNLICGSIAGLMAVKGNPEWSLFFIVLGAVFDFFDGFAARLCKVSSPFGKELDSLADVVTFGLAPSYLVFHLSTGLNYPPVLQPVQFVIPYFAFLLAAFSGLRLAKFNLDERQTTQFIGLPTPANALFWAALTIGLNISSEWVVYALAVLIVLACYLMISEIPMFALKFKTFGWKANRLRYLFILSSLVILILGGVLGIAVVILWYVILSVIANRMHII